MVRRLPGSVRSRGARSLVAAGACALATTAHAPTASASPESEAKDLFARARELRGANDCGSAAPLFAKAARLYPAGLGSLRNLAECEELLGHYASSRRTWLDLRRALLARTPDPKYAGWEKDAEQAAARLRPRVATFVVDVYVRSADGEALAGESTGVELLVNGESIGTALVGTPLERDPGTYRIRARLEGAPPVEQTVTIAAGDNPHVTLRLARPIPAAAPAPSAPPPKVVVAPDEHAGRRTAGFVVGGIGGGLLVGSLVTFLVRSGARSDLDAACPTHTGCPESVRGTVDRGTTMTTLTNVLFPVGLAAVGVGAALVLTSRGPMRPAASVALRLAPGGASLEGSF